MKRRLTTTSDRALYEFIKVYHANEPLWNTKHPFYSKVNVRAACYDALVEKMQETQPDATRDDVLRKINTIRSSFRKEYRKVIYSESVGKSYTPRLWYYKNLTFLIDNYRSEETESEEYITPNQTQEITQNESQNDHPEPSTIEEDDQVSYLHRSIRTEEFETLKRGPGLTRRKHQSHAIIFGKHVSAKLEMVSREQRVYLEKLINDAIFEAELGNLGRECRIVLD